MDNLEPAEPTVIDLLGHLAWRPPSVVREATMLPDAIDAFRQSQLSQIKDSERKLEKWIAVGHAKRERFWRKVSGKRGSGALLAQLADLIDAFERSQLDFAKDLSRQRKALVREQRQAAKLSGAAAAVLKEVDTRLLAAREKELQERLDFALFLRACRVELDSSSRGGKTFDRAVGLKRYLNSLRS